MCILRRAGLNGSYWGLLGSLDNLVVVFGFGDKVHKGLLDDRVELGDDVFSLGQAEVPQQEIIDLFSFGGGSVCEYVCLVIHDVIQILINFRLNIIMTATKQKDTSQKLHAPVHPLSQSHSCH